MRPYIVFFSIALYTLFIKLYLLFSLITMYHKYASTTTIAMFLMYKIKILDIAVNIIIVMFDILFIIAFVFLGVNFIFNIDFNILPPSSGYIGIRLNAAIIRFE